MTTGYKIKKLREERKFSQPELANMLGISQAKLSNIENGKTESIDFSFMDKICKVFDKNFDYFTENKVINKVKKNDNGAVVNYNGTVNLFPENILVEIKKLIEQNQQQSDLILELKKENGLLKKG